MRIREEHAPELSIFIVVLCFTVPIILENFNYVPYYWGESTVTAGSGNIRLLFRSGHNQWKISSELNPHLGRSGEI